MRELRASMKEYGPAAKKALRDGMREVAAGLVGAVRARTKKKSGRLANSWRVYGGVNGALIGSPLVQAPVIEFAYKGGYAGLSSTMGPPPRNVIPVVRGAEHQIQRTVETVLQRVSDEVFAAEVP